MKMLVVKHIGLHIAGLTQAAVGLLTRNHQQWISGKSKLLLAQTYRLQRRVQRAALPQ